MAPNARDRRIGEIRTRNLWRINSPWVLCEL